MASSCLSSVPYFFGRSVKWSIALAWVKNKYAKEKKKKAPWSKNRSGWLLVCEEELKKNLSDLLVCGELAAA